jgi:hypothetical protein
MIVAMLVRNGKSSGFLVTTNTQNQANANDLIIQKQKSKNIDLKFFFPGINKSRAPPKRMLMIIVRTFEWKKIFQFD